jgi:hypothetical protein
MDHFLSALGFLLLHSANRAFDRTVLLGMHPEEAEEPRGRRRREWNGGTRIGMYYRR